MTFDKTSGQNEQRRKHFHAWKTKHDYHFGIDRDKNAHNTAEMN